MNLCALLHNFHIEETRNMRKDGRRPQAGATATAVSQQEQTYDRLHSQMGYGQHLPLINRLLRSFYVPAYSGLAAQEEGAGGADAERPPEAGGGSSSMATSGQDDAMDTVS